MQVTKTTVAFRDARGAITDILKREPVEYVTLITSVKGCARGHHYHEKTTQWVYLLRGRIKVLAQMPGEAVERVVLEPGDLVHTPPHERHALVALEDSEFLVFTRGPRGGEDYEQDTFRLAQPLRDPAES